MLNFFGVKSIAIKINKYKYLGIRNMKKLIFMKNRLLVDLTDFIIYNLREN